MKFPTLLVTTLVACAIQIQGYARTDRRVSSIEKRQTTNADQMVQNILQWLQGVYAQNSRRIRQGTLREYLPPSNTEKPRPFQPGYPQAGFSPEPPFPFPTNPATGGVTAPEGYQPSEGDNDILLPPDHGSGGGENGYSKPDVQSGFTLPPAGPATPTTPGPEQPEEHEQPQEQPGYPTGQPILPSEAPTIPSQEQPGPFPTHPGIIPEGGPSTSVPGYTSTGKPELPGYSSTGQPEQPGYHESTPGAPFTSQPGVSTPESEHAQPIFPPYSSPEGTGHPPQEGITGYPAPGQPQPTPDIPAIQTSTNLIPELDTRAESEEPTRIPFGPGSTLPPLQPTTAEAPGFPQQPSEQPEEHHAIPEGTLAPEGTIAPEGPALPSEGPSILPSEGPEPVPSEGPEPVPSEGPEPVPSEEPESIPSEGPAPVPSEGPEPIPSEGSIIPEEPASGSTLPSSGVSIPSGFTTSTTGAPSETEKPAESAPIETDSYGSTISPEANTIPGKPEPSVIDEEELKHPPHIHAIDVQCSKEMMTINIEFNREFNGVIYSKGHYNNPECRYVQENSAQTKYSFTVNLEMCGTEFVNAFDTENKSYLENVLVLQNEPGIQEVWDTVRSVRCLWEGNIKDTLSVAFSIGMLSQEIVTFSGDTAMAKLDVVLGRGPFGEPANGLVKIGEQMTMVVSVSGDPGFDLQVKDCKAVDSEGKNSVALTDEDGCILKPKLFGAFQKTRDTGSTGASIIAYAYFNAFKFPDEMDLMIECNIELCKTDCDICSKDGQQLEPAKRRRRRDVPYNTTVTGDWVTMGKLVRVILPEDLNENTALEVSSKNHICMSIQSFVFSTAVLVSILVISCFTCVCLWIKRREKMYLKY